MNAINNLYKTSNFKLNKFMIKFNALSDSRKLKFLLNFYDLEEDLGKLELRVFNIYMEGL